MHTIDKTFEFAIDENYVAPARKESFRIRSRDGSVSLLNEIEKSGSETRAENFSSTNVSVVNKDLPKEETEETNTKNCRKSLSSTSIIVLPRHARLQGRDIKELPKPPKEHILTEDSSQFVPPR